MNSTRGRARHDVQVLCLLHLPNAPASRLLAARLRGCGAGRLVAAVAFGVAGDLGDLGDHGDLGDLGDLGVGARVVCRYLRVGVGAGTCAVCRPTNRSCLRDDKDLRSKIYFEFLSSQMRDERKSKVNQTSSSI